LIGGTPAGNTGQLSFEVETIHKSNTHTHMVIKLFTKILSNTLFKVAIFVDFSNYQWLQKLHLDINTSFGNHKVSVLIKMDASWPFQNPR
jgi:hypothetical protein